MKTPLLVALAFLPCVALADSSTSTTSPTTTTANITQPDPTQELAAMTEKLKLSPSQQDSIKPILVTEADKRKAIADDTSLSAKQKHDQIGAVHRASLKQIKALFTPEQMAQIEQGQSHTSASPTSPTSTANP